MLINSVNFLTLFHGVCVKCVMRLSLCLFDFNCGSCSLQRSAPGLETLLPRERSTGAEARSTGESGLTRVGETPAEMLDLTMADPPPRQTHNTIHSDTIFSYVWCFPLTDLSPQLRSEQMFDTLWNSICICIL